MHKSRNSELNPDIKRNKRPLHVLRASYFNILNQTMLISRQNGQRTQIDAASPFTRQMKPYRFQKASPFAVFLNRPGFANALDRCKYAVTNETAFVFKLTA